MMQVCTIAHGNTVIASGEALKFVDHGKDDIVDAAFKRDES